MTFFHKRIFPWVFFGFLVVFVVFTTVLGFGKGQVAPPIFYVVPVVMAAFAYFLLRKLVFDLADEVVDLGDMLLVRNGGKEDRIALSDIRNISYTFANPPRVTLSLRKPSMFGDEVSFSPPAHFKFFNPFAKNPIVNSSLYASMPRVTPNSPSAGRRARRAETYDAVRLVQHSPQSLIMKSRTPQSDIDLTRRRLRDAKRDYVQRQGRRTSHDAQGQGRPE
jgi:hypothetical protein